jgi:hypothetical protein
VTLTEQVAQIRDNVDTMAQCLRWWNDRPTGQKATPQRHQSGMEAAVAIDALLRDLHAIRRQLNDELTADDNL